MSTNSAAFQSVKDEFEQSLALALTLEKVAAPMDQRKHQLHDVGKAAAKLIGFPAVITAKEHEPLREKCFVGRGLNHSVYSPPDGPKTAYPPSYDGLRKITHLIQEERALRKAALTSQANKKKGKNRNAPESEDEMEVLAQRLLRLLSISVSSQMQVDDEDNEGLPRDLHFKKNNSAPQRGCDHCLSPAHGNHPFPKSGEPSLSKSARRKRRRVEFDENAFIQDEAIVDLIGSANANRIINEANHVATMSTDFLDLVPAIRKRLHELMVDVAVVNERIKADLSLRATYIDDAAELTERLKECTMPEPAPEPADGSVSA
ncbi:hypothetical protein C8R44DRAFT_891897 [Mycena epipterygia]|nr:hypothetical protein C8R44DRAFT_891897 [Mycena epipterygia]